MKKLLISVLLLPVLASAQEPVIVEKPVLCVETKELLSGLQEKFGESPIWIGQDEKSQYSVLVSKSGSWTIIQFTENVGCILGIGSGSREIFQSPKI